MTEIPEFPQKQSGALVGVAAMECLLRGDAAELNELLQNADDVELAFAVAFLAENFGSFIAQVAPDPQAVIDRLRRELLDG